MTYVFNLVGVTTPLELFQRQQLENGPAYLAAPEARLDCFLACLQEVSPQRGWPLDQVVDSVIHYWMQNAELIYHWRSRLIDAGRDALLVGSVGNVEDWRFSLEVLIGR
jgi:hypothetical protein